MQYFASDRRQKIMPNAHISPSG